jgi:hypothetical protein
MKTVAKDVVYPDCIMESQSNAINFSRVIKEIREGSANSMKVDYH